MSHRKKILWLPSWYPNKYDAFDGDFIQRHARAASIHHNIFVLALISSSEQKTLERQVSKQEGLVEEIIYLPKGKSPAARAKHIYNWQKHYRDAVEKLIAENHIDLVHVHVPWKAGLLALWVKKKFKIPYLVTEHWGIYNKVAEDNIFKKSVLSKQLLKKIFSDAACFVSVSRFIAEGVNETLVSRNYDVIPNVVDTSLFYPTQNHNEVFTFIHVSNMVPLKNVEGILKAFKSFLQNSRQAARLVMVGNRDAGLQKFAMKLGLQSSEVEFCGELPYHEVAELVRSSDAFILNSNIENSPCVIGEALCCGLPVIATRVGGIPELVNEQNGILIDPNQQLQLAEAMAKIYSSKEFDKSIIAEAAERKFSYSTVAESFCKLYMRDHY